MDSRRSSSSYNQPEKNSNNPIIMNYLKEDWIKCQLKERQLEYTDYHSINLYIGTWNVNGKKPIPLHESYLLRKWILDIQGKAPDIIVLGFQEIVDLNAVNVVVNNSSQNRSGLWEETISSTLRTFQTERPVNNTPEENNRYKLVMEKHLVGILHLVYVKEKHFPSVNNVSANTAGVGVMGMMGNKGGVAIRMDFYQSTFCFICSHLAAHRENVSGRNADYHNIISKISFQDENANIKFGFLSPTDAKVQDPTRVYGVFDHDFVIWLGDLNYRIHDDISVDQCYARIQANDLNYLSDYDQLRMEMKKKTVFEGFQEGNLDFLPTYKYQPGTNLYERRPEKKIRAPAWCDRVLWKTMNENSLSLIDYNCSSELDLSDHKPVYACFSVQIKYIVEEKKSKVIRDIMHQLDKWENENMPKVEVTGSVLSFPQVFYMTPITQTLSIENTGQVVAPFRFIPKLDDQRFCKSWISISPAFGMIPPREKVIIEVRLIVDNATACALSSGQDTLDDTMILRIENGRDYFFIVSGQYQPSCFGASLEQLVHTKTPIRNYLPISTFKEKKLDETKIKQQQQQQQRTSICDHIKEQDEDETQKIPKELWRIVDDLYKCGIQEKGIFLEFGNHMEISQIREELDTCIEFSSHSPHSMAETLVTFLQCLREPILPDHLIDSCEMDPQRIQLNGRALLNGLSSVHYNAFVYIISFLREVLKHAHINKTTPETLAYAFSKCLIRKDISIQDSLQKLLVYFLTTQTL